MARIYYMKGLITDIKQNRENLFETSLLINEQALKMLNDKKINNEKKEHLETSILFNIGMLYDNWNKIDDAKVYFERTMNKATEYDNNIDKLKALQAIANIYIKQKQYKLAKDLYKDGEKLVIKMNENLDTPSEDLIELQYQLGKVIILSLLIIKLVLFWNGKIN